ncbi:helix-turn-helix domain-containing protein [Clostridium perfringens]|uniref:S24 family peptidase n=6 Tax=Clostridium perfringens TaxID=1502 RepID=UPI0009919D65|nr:S24 family peptidase [Clostridium perfringens]AQW28355.1 LexA family transcriptional regulator [Clostridium perfringens]MBO3339203.1 helix-turn-helix domain-containing protein [Clostridium perfringens]MBO3386279.1 helix-turn-helix domain-containing protein [Clostridium perfringens]MBO3399063.1 helix-turn-helix domain-containing protein [Clostridium perfringens]MBO3421268.1 helix-turn-helix domain-containing protein [Clostridium perfringens]
MTKEIGLHRLATTLKDFRKDNKISQEDFAKQLEIARSTLSYYERAKSEPPIYTLVKMSEVMNCSIDELLGTTKAITNSDEEKFSYNELTEKIYYLNELIDRNRKNYEDLIMSKKRTERMFDELSMSKKRTERMFDELSMSKKRTERMFDELLMSKKRTERMFIELNRITNRSESDILTFQKLSKEFASLLDKNKSIENEYSKSIKEVNEDNIFNYSITEKENFLSSNLKDLISNLNFIPIDVVGEVSCGTPSYAFNEISKSIALPSNYKDCFALRVKGNSMNKLFKDNELIICCRNKTPIDGDIVIAYLSENNEATCKKIHKKKDKLELHPCSTLPYEIQYYDKNSDINIIGVVLGSLTDILDLENIDIEDLEEKLNTI